MTVNQLPILITILCEVIIYFTEMVLSARDSQNAVLRKANKIQECDFIDLQKGFRTGLSYFRTSMFIAYIVVVIMFIDASQAEKSLSNILLFVLIGILFYMLTMMNQRIFIFHTNYFIIGAPFHFFKRDAIIRYEEIENFQLYVALYSAYYIRIRFKDGSEKLYHFSGSFLPRNDLVLRVILNTVTGSKKDFRKSNRKAIKHDFIDDTD